MKKAPHIEILVHCPNLFSTHFKKTLKKAALISLKHIPKSLMNKKVRGASDCFISIAIVGPKQIQKLNLQYRNKNKPTDVLSFSRMEPSLAAFSFEETDLGDVLICWSIAKKQAAEYKTTLQEELARLTVHGVLHLFGYDHEIGLKEEKRMFRLQEKILKGL